MRAIALARTEAQRHSVHRCLAGRGMAALGEVRAAPQQCTIDGPTVHIDERSRFDSHGNKLEQLGGAPALCSFARAKYSREGQFRWSWPLIGDEP